jgi:hypothetical protein
VQDGEDRAESSAGELRVRLSRRTVEDGWFLVHYWIFSLEHWQRRITLFGDWDYAMTRTKDQAPWWSTDIT